MCQDIDKSNNQAKLEEHHLSSDQCSTDPRCHPVAAINRQASSNAIEVKHRSSSCGEQTWIASTRDDLAECYRLVYKIYLDCGYTDLKPEQMRVNLWNALPGTFTLIAKKADKLAGTLTCVMDSEAGLPADGFCSEELQKLRESGRRLCELSGLAVDRKHANATTVLRLFRYALTLTTGFMEGTDFIITVHPKHAPFYEDLLLFEKLKAKQQYAHVEGAPAVLLRLNLETLRDRYYEKYAGLRGRKDLHHFYFVEDQDSILQSIRNGLQERQRQLNEQSLERFFFSESQVLTNEDAFRTFRTQWDSWNHSSTGS
ncbi:MAG: hypothetical protein VBE63_15625 [Lamprobacter sp.]|uniref:N-acyl amino acid synthase FeeM domain-containing protein n=1 Tax=Lamprobacter sp. TaxID=3100796 RepID=UPI002B25C567|nr:hypothetical protein [Lamprobacter sp.]MEA3641353.1 hypothetical protein [Lamprobacter sp.]